MKQQMDEEKATPKTFTHPDQPQKKQQRHAKHLLILSFASVGYLQSWRGKEDGYRRNGATKKNPNNPTSPCNDLQTKRSFMFLFPSHDLTCCTN
jgi:hypothetical protein